MIDILTPRLRLRHLRDADAEVTAHLMTPDVSRWTAVWSSPCTLEFAIERIRVARQGEAGGTRFDRAIERRVEGDLIGWMNLKRDAANGRRAQFGYWIAASCHGQGLGGEAAKAFVDAVWEPLDIDIIEAGVQAGNEPSLAILRRLGMRAIGERTEWAPARLRNETCIYFELERPR